MSLHPSPVANRLLCLARVAGFAGLPVRLTLSRLTELSLYCQRFFKYPLLIPDRYSDLFSHMNAASAEYGILEKNLPAMNMISEIKPAARLLTLFLLLYLVAACGRADLSANFGDFSGTFVLYEQSSGRYTIVGKNRANARFSPMSTFKIPNSIIALETGVVADTGQVLSWDTLSYPVESWWPETWQGQHTLSSAMRYSVVPVYRTLATKIGNERMQTYIGQFGYGNGDISSGIDRFWLNGSLKISAKEQVDFLRRFYQDELQVATATTGAVKGILVREKNDDYRLSYKTGAGSLGNGKKSAIGWLVGYVEKQDDVYFFALNIEGESFAEILAPRLEITKAMLRDLDIITP